MPWKPQYNEKFHIKLTKESPLVLVLSQLDTRYFRGLQGQYNFRLQFRVHEEGRPGAEEYIVRSHGNYLMDRSVSVELPSLGPGNFVVFISIVGERNTRVLSTEEVIRRECRGREENDKLAKVGQAYDLAHSKAASHLQQLSKVRKQAESKKASESRRKERRKNWEKRKTGREISRKQKGKDDAKKASMRAEKKAKADAAAAAAKEKAEAEKKSKAAEEERASQAKLEAANKQVKDLKEADNASTTSTLSSSTGTPQYTPQETPKSESAQPVEGSKNIDVPPVENNNHASSVSGGPPAPSQHQQSQPLVQTLCTAAQAEGNKSLELKLHYCSCSTCKPPPKAEETDYSSDSPVEDYELLYDSDDVTPTLRLTNAPQQASNNNAQDSDDDDVPEPWNAIAVIGFRVYSKDEDLELRVIMEGGELEQDGMGNLGEADLDNAVSNAAGQREKKKQTEKKEGEPVKPAGEGEVPQVNVIADTDTEAKNGAQDAQNKMPASSMAAYRTIIERQTSEYDRVMGKTKSDSQQGTQATSDKVDAAASVDSEKPAAADSQATQANNDKIQSWRSETPKVISTTKEKAVWYLRHKLQSGLVTKAKTQGLTPDDMAEMSRLLAELEAFADLEAPILRATKIHKVLQAVVKMERIPKDDESSLWMRVQALLDDYELTLATADDDEPCSGAQSVAGSSESGRDGYFARSHEKH